MFNMMKSFRKMVGKSFWRYLLRWTLLSIPTGIITGLSIVLLVVSTEYAWNVWYGKIPKWLIVFIPSMGGLIAGYIASKTMIGVVHGAEMIIDALHKYGGQVPFLTAPIGFLTSLATIGLGGSAGLEGPSLQIGGTIGSALASKAKLSTMDRRILMLSGAAAGISAAFRAPLTGAIFAMEVPYKNDLEHEAAVPALTSSVTSYITFILILGSKPLFKTSTVSFTYSDVPFFILQGLFSAAVSLTYVVIYNDIGDVFHRLRLPIAIKAGIGGLLVGLTGFVSPHVLGVGYPGIQHMLNRDFSLEYVVMLLVLKIIATSFTLGSGGNGGVFIPTVFIGAATGAIFGMTVTPNKLGLFETLGMASVLAASSKVPIAAVAFVAETTTPTYIIPAIICSTVSYLVSGGVSLYSHQQVVKPTLVDATIGEIMEEKFISVNANSSLEDVAREVFRHHHKVFPVTIGDTLVGVISISDIIKIPRENWKITPVSDVMTKGRILTATPDQSVSEIVATMGKRGIAMVPVVDSKKSARLIGVIYRYDILHAIEERRLE